MNDSARPWPPLVIARDIPRWVQARDFVLTILMWLVFAAMLETEFQLFAGPHLERLGIVGWGIEPNWGVFFERLTPFLAIVLALVLMLSVASRVTAHRRQRALSLPQPPLLEAAAQARRAGMDEAALVAARDLRIAVVHIVSDGKYRIEPANVSPEPGNAC